MAPLVSARGFPVALCVLHLGLLASFNSSFRSGVLWRSRSYLEEEWAQGVRRGGNAIMTRQALAPFAILSFHAVLHSHLHPPDPFTWHYRTAPRPEATCSQGASIYTAASFFPHYFQMCYGMFLAAARSLHVFRAHGSGRQELKNVSFFSLQNSATLQTSFQGSRSNNHNQHFSYACV